MSLNTKKSSFALFFGNRGFFPGSLMASAREEVSRVLKGLGHDVIMMDESATRYGAVETPAEGRKYAAWLRENTGKFDGVIISLPNFGDETGAVAALKDCGVPIFVQAYPDENDKMANETRRDAFCGKISVMDVFYQGKVPFTVLKPHVVSPSSPAFAANVDYFDRVCRVVKSVKGMVVGAIGARTSAFKTVRIDEIALQKHDITMETFDLSDVFAKMDKISDSDAAYKAKATALEQYSDFSGTPKSAFEKIARLGVVIDSLIDEFQLDAIALRCWVEMQFLQGISPCVLLSELNNRGKIAACEVDVGNAISMYALAAASGDTAACLDWNNNYGDDLDKCILFHCGPVPQSMMSTKGRIEEHAILANACGKGCSYGCNVGRIAAMPFTFASMMTENGGLKFYAGEGEFTSDPIAADFFGCAGVAKIPNLQDVMLHVAQQGHRHHVSVTPGHVLDPLHHALTYYLGFDVTTPGK